MRLLDSFALLSKAGQAVPLEGLKAATQAFAEGVLVLPDERNVPGRRACWCPLCCAVCV